MTQEDVKMELRHTLEELRKPGELFEIRILNTKDGVVSGYFDDYAKASQAVIPYDGRHDVYVTLNPVKPELRSARNILNVRVKRATTDKDIDKISWVMIDIDSIRPTKVSATETEKEAALSLAKRIQEDLGQNSGFPKPLFADSGNGYHLLYRTNLDNTSENKNILKRFLQSLDSFYSNEQAQVDTTTYNPARIIKFYGTTACKGDNASDRPHRRSKIIDIGDRDISVTAAQITAIGNRLPEPTQRVQSRKVGLKKANTQGDFDLLDWLDQHGLNVISSKNLDDGGTLYVLEKCPWKVEHTNQSAFVIAFADGGFHAGCHHNSCQGQDWRSLVALYPDGAPSHYEKSDESQTNIILRLAQDFSYFIDELGEKYVAVPWPTHTEIMPMDGQRFKLRLTQDFYNDQGEAPNSDAVNRALDVLRAQALFGGETKKLQPRVALQNGDYYYDLGDPVWKAVRVNEEGCSISPTPPILFVRSKNTAEQIIPDFSSKPEQLSELVKKHFRWKDESDVRLFTAYLVSCFLPQIPHPVLVVYGEKGSAKSTTMRMVKKIVDPAKQELLAMPTHRQELAITLTNNYLPCFDNLESLSAEKSNILCMAATGGAFTARTLYTNSEETILSFKRPVALNGINVVATRSDLLDRSIVLELTRVRHEERKPESAIWKEFEEELPKFLGSIFNTISQAIKIQKDLTLDEVGRMADFTYWGYAIAEVIGIGGEEFIAAYLGNQAKANEEALAGHPVGTAILGLMSRNSKWAGSVTELLRELELVAVRDSINTKVKTWAKDPNVLSRRLNEVKSNLEEVGIFYDIRNTGTYKRISLEKIEN